MKTEKEPLYNIRVEKTNGRGMLLQMTGARDTVLDAAIRVMLDSAPEWENWQPFFTVYIYKIK